MLHKNEAPQVLKLYSAAAGNSGGTVDCFPKKHHNVKETCIKGRKDGVNRRVRIYSVLPEGGEL